MTNNEFRKKAIEPCESLDKIVEYLESLSKQKIDKALEILESNDLYSKTVEERYLNLVSARVNKKEVAIKDFESALLSKKDVDLLTDTWILDVSYIDYTLMTDYQTKLIVDFIGAMVKNHLDIETYIEEAKSLSSENDLRILFNQYSSKLKKDIEETASYCPKGWYSKICRHFLDMKLKRVIFDNTAFKEANKSLVLKEYIFFLGMVAEKDLIIDVYKSDFPNFTNLFWMLKEVPYISTLIGQDLVCENPLSFDRKIDNVYKEKIAFDCIRDLDIKSVCINIKKKFAKDLHINNSLSREEYDYLASRCAHDIPKILEKFWISSDGFSSSCCSLLSMVDSFGGQDFIDRMCHNRKSDKLLGYSLLNYELFEDNIESIYKIPTKINIESILENCIFLQCFSEDLLSYTLCKLDYKRNKEYRQLYYTNEDGIYPLKLSLHEYIDSMFELKGVVEDWPLFFIDDTNINKTILDNIKKILDKAKRCNDERELGINFKRLNL